MTKLSRRKTVKESYRDLCYVRGHLFIHAHFPEKLPFLTPWYAQVREYQGVKNVSFSENFGYVLNDGPYNYPFI